MMLFTPLLYLNQKELLVKVRKSIPEGFSIYYKKDKFMYVVHKDVRDKQLPLLLSHLDTVDENIANFKEKDIGVTDGIVSLLSGAGKAKCLGGDDRCGVFIMLTLLQSNPKDYRFLFTFDEEVGGFGGMDFVESKYYNEDLFTAYISLDRRSEKGKPEIACYGFPNQDLLSIFTDEYKEDFGSFTDCVTLSTAGKLACYNLSVGYDNEHTKHEIIYLSEVKRTCKKLQDPDVIKKLQQQQFPAEDIIGNGWNQYSNYTYNDAYYSTSGIMKPVECDVCGVHDVLYEYDGLSLCTTCVEEELIEKGLI